MSKARVIGTTVQAIKAAEIALGRNLPQSFINWLLTNNGRSLRGLNVFPVFDPRDPRKTWDSIVRHYDSGWQEWQDNFSDTDIDFSTLLPFSEFGTGDYYCFDYSVVGAADEPVIVLWAHETGTVVQVADSFLSFLVMSECSS